jgi:hypothetical protein
LASKLEEKEEGSEAKKISGKATLNKQIILYQR